MIGQGQTAKIWDNPNHRIVPRKSGHPNHSGKHIMNAPFRKFLPLVVLGVLMVSSAGIADVVILKDGHVLEGKVRRESFTEFDANSREAFNLPKGFFMVEDNTRRVVFSPSIVRSTDQKNLQPEEFYGNSRPLYMASPKAMPAVSGMKEVGKWNSKWDREIQVFSPVGVVGVSQHLQYLGAKTLKIDSTKNFPWSSHYLTSELDRKMVDELISTHPDFQKKLEKGSPQGFARDLKLSQFLFQAGRLNDVIKKVEDLLPEYEANKEFTDKLGELRKKAFEQIQHQKVIQAKSMMAEGYFEPASNLLGSVVENQCAEGDLVDLRAIKAKAEKEMELYREIKAALEEITKELTGSDLLITPKMVAQLLKESTTVENPKFEPFLSQFKQWKKNDKPKDDGQPEKMAALALTGWTMGAPGADPNPKTAKRLWELREQLKATIFDMAVNRRSDQLKELEKNFPEKTTVDDVTVLLNSLGPIDKDASPPRFPESPSIRNFPPTFGLPGGSYMVQVPQQYDPAIPAPVIIVLGSVVEKPADTMIRWREQANREGYILAVPTWAEGAPPTKYQYSVKEHENVLACLRDLRARYRVDSDRVFLVGHFEGAQLAFDFGLSHPDLFAGVVPMSAAPRYYSEKYWRNGVYLPFYVVTGDRTGEVHNKVKDLFTNWTTKGYGSIWVQYKGRGLDHFNGEIPNVLAWMKDKKRVFPLRTLGSDGNGGFFGNEFRTMRTTDSHFYWLEAMEVSSNCIGSPPPQWDERISPATLHARAEPDKNEVTIKTQGIKKIAFLIQRNSKGECCLNLDKPVTVRWNMDKIIRNQKIKIDMEMLLEDQAHWQDRQRLLLSRLEFGGR